MLSANKRDQLKRVAKVLNSPEHLRKGRIHLIDVLKALKIYQPGGQLGRSQKTGNLFHALSTSWSKQ